MQLVSIKEASEIASGYSNKTITESNISYLIQYGRINKYRQNGATLVSISEVENYYSEFNNEKKAEWKEKLGHDLNWKLSFEKYKESETTKHVHRLHPYKGKFIPQLVQYFLDDHTDIFKREVYFNKGDIIIDPFCGSGTTLVQSNELGIHAIGIDISEFNSMISNCKIEKYDLIKLKDILNHINARFDGFQLDKDVEKFEGELLSELYKFNNQYFPSPEYKKKVYSNTVNEKQYGKEKEEQFYPIYKSLTEKYSININNQSHDSFIDKWYFETAKEEIFFINELINKIKNITIKQLIQVILSRTIRSCRATTHSDLATLIKPVYTTYYCTKHKKICKPLFSIKKWWNKYTIDTLKRIENFNKVKTDTIQKCITGNSMSIDIKKEIEMKIPTLLPIYNRRGIKGIFSSPPYVGLIDYHEQHAYSYELFSLKRRDSQEIGPLSNGYGIEAKKTYIEGISKVLINCIKYLDKDFEIFLVANDKHKLYPKIADASGLKIVDMFKRPVLNRTEKDKAAYSECIFRMKEK